MRSNLSLLLLRNAIFALLRTLYVSLCGFAFELQFTASPARETKKKMRNPSRGPQLILLAPESSSSEMESREQRGLSRGVASSEIRMVKEETPLAAVRSAIP